MASLFPCERSISNGSDLQRELVVGLIKEETMDAESATRRQISGKAFLLDLRIWKYDY